MDSIKNKVAYENKKLVNTFNTNLSAVNKDIYDTIGAEYLIELKNSGKEIATQIKADEKRIR